jgi:hypothetical protein
MSRAEAVLERGLALCAEVPVLFPPFAGDLAVVRALDGRVGEAVELAAQAVGRGERMGRLGRLSLIVTHLGEVLLIAGRRGEALTQARRALALARHHKERGNQVYALRLLALTLAEAGAADPGVARGHGEEALALAESLGMRPLAARCHLALAGLAADGERAAWHRDSAATLLRAMGMTYWLSRVEAMIPSAPEIP